MLESYRVPVTDRDFTRAGLALHLVAASTGVSMRAVENPKRGGPGLRVRRLAMSLAHVAYGWTVERVAHAFGLNRATAAKACTWAEDPRDDPVIDAMMDTLEGCLKAILPGDGTAAPA